MPMGGDEHKLRSRNTSNIAATHFVETQHRSAPPDTQRRSQTRTLHGVGSGPKEMVGDPRFCTRRAEASKPSQEFYVLMFPRTCPSEKGTRFPVLPEL